MDQPQSPPNPSQPSNDWTLTYLLPIVLAVSLAVATVVGLCFVSMNYFLPVMIVGGVIFALTAFHYVVWGWWLAGVLGPPPPEDEPEHEPLPDSFADDAARRWKQF